jgi:hypothetical protein
VFICEARRTPRCARVLVRIWVHKYTCRLLTEIIYNSSARYLGLEEYQLRRGRGAIIHWHLVFNAYTLLTLLRQSTLKTSNNFRKCLITFGDVCRWVKRQARALLQEAGGLALPEIQASSKAQNHLPTAENIEKRKTSVIR